MLLIKKQDKIKMTIVYAQSGKGNQNLVETLQAQLDAVPIRGKDFLLKPNMVDPHIPKACSDPKRMQAVVNLLREYGAARVLIGDEPAHYVFGLAERQGSPFDIQQAYQQVGYARIKGAELIDLSSLPVTSYQAIRVSPITAQEETITVPIRNTTGLVVVSFTLPKHHGNYNYSGVTKNLMGLVPEAARKEPFHYFFADAARQSLREEGKDSPRRQELEQRVVDLTLGFVDRYTELHGENELMISAYHAWLDEQLDFQSFQTHLEHFVNAGSLVGLASKVRQMSPESFCILDGTYLLTQQEHDGIPVQTNFALVGADPASVDKVAMERLGMYDSEVPYLNQLLKATSTVEVRGKIGRKLSKRSLLAKEIRRDSHGLPFSFVA